LEDSREARGHAVRDIDPASSLLLTDLYELNMMQAYLEAGMTEPAVFEFFVRKLPEPRGFLMAAGLEQVVDFLANARFTEDELRWLAGSGRFSRRLLDHLAEFRFTGTVDAMPEGTVFFPDEPILRVTAPLPEAQLLETRLINLLHFQTVIASKAARMVLAAPDSLLVDFGLRRAHGAEAGLLATPAEPLFGVPIFGTMAHSFIQAYGDETAAFEAFARSRPDNAVLLLDTYDTEVAARKVVALAPRLRRDGIPVRAVRLDSGDLAAHARKVRRILDRGGLAEVGIFASGGVDETVLQRFTAAEVPIDGYGIGTSLTTSPDAAALDCAYKLQEYAGRPRRKRSEGKATWPGRKQVFRRHRDGGVLAGDLLTVEGGTGEGEPLIEPVMRDGQSIGTRPTLEQARDNAAAQLARLPEHLRRLETSPAYPVAVSAALRELADEVDRELEAA
jgi:nicotinate phosphoribosyltransferase